ncbi:MAG: integrase arm-type DNA-binding domain-containing protein [Roseomonas sp.]|nr:integrase arm-type DNA-binding domain-containing protein [Roseomonas sp.]
MPLRFTEELVGDLQCPAGQKDKMFFDDKQKGLGIRVTQAGGKVFVAQWTDPATGQKRREVLGASGAITLDQARKAAAAHLGDVAKGLDPRAERLAKAELLRKAKEAAKQAREAAKAAKLEAAFTLERLVTDWAAIGLAKRRPRYKAEAVRALRYGFPKDWTRPASALTKARIVKIQDALTKDGKHASASRLAAYGRAAYAWAEKRGTLPANPFEGLPTGAAAVVRDRLLTDDEIGAIWNAAFTMPEPAGPFVRLALLTLARREEVAGMRWSEISADLSVWTIPAHRMKRGQAHSVVLTDAAREALGAVTRIDGQDLVFTTTGKTPISGFSKIKAKLDKLSGVTGWVLHDFRRAGPSTLARLGFSSILADKLLAHQPSALSSVARTYQQHDFSTEKQAALEAWAAHVLRCAKPEKEGDKVTSLAEHRAARAG